MGRGRGVRERLREREGERDLCDCMNFMILLFVSQGKAVFIAIHLRITPKMRFWKMMTITIRKKVRYAIIIIIMQL